MIARVLLADDEPDILAPVCYALERAGFGTEVAHDGERALELARAERFDVVVLDVMMPRLSGLDVCRELRSESDVPIVMLTARDAEVDRVLGLELGADDYVTKPFSPRELTARVTALLRRSTRGPAPSGVVRYGPIVIDAERHHVAVDGQEVKLTAKEFLLLQYLLQHRGRVLSRDLLLTDVWGYHYTGGTRTVDVHIRRLREKIPVLADAIETIKQFGYKLLDQP